MKKILSMALLVVLVLCTSFAFPADGEETKTTIVPYGFTKMETVLPTPPQAEAKKEPPCRYRDDIVTDGNLLSYDLQETMQDCCEKYDVPYAAMLALADVETRFTPDAVSKTNDYGLMQINKCNHEWLLEQGIDPLTPAGNIEAGAYIISQHLQNYEELELAFMAYNCGPSGAKKLWNSGIYQTDYTKKIMAAYEHWSGVLEG